MPFLPLRSIFLTAARMWNCWSNSARNEKASADPAIREKNRKRKERFKMVGVHPMVLRAEVLLAFEENGSSKVGGRFDKPVLEGNDLGGLCEQNHGFFCNADDLHLESSSGEEIDKIAINTMFELDDGSSVLACAKSGHENS